MSKLDTIQLQINSKVDPKKKPFWTIKFLLLLKISKRTAQTWRDRAKISFSQVETKFTTNYLRKANARALQQIFQRKIRWKTATEPAGLAIAKFWTISWTLMWTLNTIYDHHIQKTSTSRWAQTNTTDSRRIVWEPINTLVVCWNKTENKLEAYEKKILQHLHLQQNLLEVSKWSFGRNSESIILDIDKLSAFADWKQLPICVKMRFTYASSLVLLNGIRM
jgi:hypothetical protein